jgi:eukaryotic-like serine/threonine-protein kinase
VTEFPYAKDYQQALQNPGRVFADAGMQQARFTLDSWGLPEALTGSSAVVFHATIGAGSYALRCYTRSDASSRERYEAFDSYVSSQQLTRHVASVAWHEDAVQVNGRSWPVLQMEWIDGRILDQYVGYLAERGDTDALATLAGKWRELVRTLQDAQFAHGDLQHGNVIIDERGRLRLVDFDSVWIPLLQRQPPPTETGHENYQHPGRTASAGWGPWVDTFSGLVIYLSLAALARDPGLWLPLYSGDNLLFERDDFRAPFETDTWKHLNRISHPDIRSLVSKLQACCAPDWTPDKSLELILSPPWWERSGPSSVSGGASAARTTATSATGPTVKSDAGGEPGTAHVWRWVAPADLQPAGPTLPSPPPSTAYEAAAAGPRPADGVQLLTGRPSGQGTPGKKPGAAEWWQQSPTTVTTPPPGTPAKPDKSGHKIALGIFCIVLAVVALIGFLVAHLVAGAVIGAVTLGAAGLALVISSMSSQRNSKRPGQT